MDEGDRLDEISILTDLIKATPVCEDKLTGVKWCVFCAAFEPDQGFEHHDPSCVWRRAIEAGNMAWRNHHSLR